MIKMPNNNDFFENDLIFAKVKGFPYWPGIIIDIDKETYKTVVKYKVKFFATNETAYLNKSELCHYQENKLKYTVGTVVKKHKEDYKEALLEIEKAWKSSKSSKKRSSTSGKFVNGTPTSHGTKSTPYYQTTQAVPSVSDGATPNRSASQHPHKGSNNTDVAVNTPPYLDLNCQLNALTEKCIALELSLIEEQNKSVQLKETIIKTPVQLKNEDFHTQILKQELKKYKTENNDLRVAIGILERDLENSGKELNRLKILNQRCSHCFQPIESSKAVCEANEVNSWQQVVSDRANSHHVNTFEIECVNRYNGLLLDFTETNDMSISEDNTTTNKSSNLRLTNRQTHLKPQQKIKSSANIKENKNKNDSQLIIFADSHGKQLGNLIEQKSSANVCSFIRSGAEYDKVSEEALKITKNLTSKDHILIIAGTNNIQNTSNKNLIDNICSVINGTQHTNLIVSTIPVRYDQPNLDLKISIVNAEIENMAIKHPNLKILPLHLLPRHLYTTHGLHFNKRGKARIAEMVSKLMYGKKDQPQESIITSKSTSYNWQTAQSSIAVIEEEMSELFERYNDPSIGFAHTISRDFHNTAKHMSAGVAVEFRKKFGRPNMDDLLYKNLAFQRASNGPSVYSLVTKDIFKGKPSKDEYDEAFHQLQLDFQSRGLKTLICSAMGCVRDLIQPQHFVENIMKFQQSTKAKVYIASYNQKAKRKLWNGLTHNEFIKTLRELIAARHQHQEDSSLTQEHQKKDHSLILNISSTKDNLENMPTITDTPTHEMATQHQDTLPAPAQPNIQRITTSMLQVSESAPSDLQKQSSVISECAGDLSSHHQSFLENLDQFPPLI